MVRYRVTVLCTELRTLGGETLSFQVTRTLDAADPLIAGERALSVVRSDRALRNKNLDPWHPPSLEVSEVSALDDAAPAVNSDFEWT